MADRTRELLVAPVVWCEAIGLEPFVPGSGARFRKDSEDLERIVWHWSGGPPSRDVQGVYETLRGRGLGYDLIYSWSLGRFVLFNDDPGVATFHAGRANGTSRGVCVPGRSQDEIANVLEVCFRLVWFYRDLEHVGHFELSTKKRDPGRVFMEAIRGAQAHYAPEEWGKYGNRG